MSSPERKETKEASHAKSDMVLPRLDQKAAINSTNDNPLPARPVNFQFKESPEQDLEEKLKSLNKKIAAQEKIDLSKLSQVRTNDLNALVAKSEQKLKAVLTTLFFGQEIDREISALAEAILRMSANSTIISQVADGSLSRESLAHNLLDLIHQQRTSDCTLQEIAMLDSLEFHLMKMLNVVNPTVKINLQQQLQNELEKDDESGGGGGPEKAEGRDPDEDDAGEMDLDEDNELIPRTRRGKARARAKARKSRYRKWLARMLRAFRRQTALQRNRAKVTSSGQIRMKSHRESPFVRTVRVFGRVTDYHSNLGVGGIRIISNCLGEIITSPDGSYAFENVVMGVQYSLAPFKSGSSFTPVSINDIALDSREHNFKIVF